MSVRSKCEGCKLAVWSRTATGRLHPDKSGRCDWSAIFRIAASATQGSAWGQRGKPIVVKGGHIWRGQNGVSACDVFQPIEQMKRLKAAKEPAQ